jgi:hypothetical protein
MKKLLIGLIAVGCFAQKAGVDGVTKRTETHRIDLSACDQVTIEGPADRIDISNGKFSVYGFKRYGISWKLECEINR